MHQHVAHVNVTTPKYAADDPRMNGFFDNVPRINALAESSPGFVWRLSDPAEEAKAPDVFGEPGLLIALSVWADLQSLHDFVYKSAHLGFLQQKTDWFQPRQTANKALWWVTPGTTPSIMEAKHRLNYLSENGPSDVAFGFNEMFKKVAN